MRVCLVFLFFIFFFFNCNKKENPTNPQVKEAKQMSDKVEKTDKEWEEILSKEAFYVLRKKGTERAFTGKFHDHHEKGVYICAACGAELFSSSTKFESGTGWPSFYEPVKKESVGEEKDRSFFMVRTEVHCARCGGHLGHVFEDGPKPTGLRYCINSVSLDFKKE
jgi:peptide-methionine (R)-S-oxide reductase